MGSGQCPGPLSCAAEERKQKEDWPERRTVPPGHGRVQLRLRTGLTGEQYVTAQGWRDATLARCPNHPGGGCSLARHGTYARKTPPGTRIARWYCPESHTTFSRLPDCLAARLAGTLAELEDVVATAERATSLEAAANAVRRDPIELPGAMRWLLRRIRLVRRAPRRLPGDGPRLPRPTRRRRGARPAARDGRTAAPGVADSAWLRAPPDGNRGFRSAIPTTDGARPAARRALMSPHPPLARSDTCSREALFKSTLA